jgi:hypothetical protein
MVWCVLQGWVQRREEQEKAALVVNADEKVGLLERQDNADASAQTGSERAHDGVWKWWQLGGLFASAVALAIFSILKGLFVCQSAPYWVFFFAPLPVCLGLAWFYAKQPPKARSKKECVFFF